MILKFFRKTNSKKIDDINTIKGILSRDNKTPNPRIFIIKVIVIILTIFFWLNKIENKEIKDNNKNFCMYEPAIASCSKKPLYLPENEGKPNISVPVICCKKISSDNKIDDINATIDSAVISNIFSKNKILTTIKSIKNLKLNIDLIKILSPKFE
jgi:hypothetical protein